MSSIINISSGILSSQEFMCDCSYIGTEIYKKCRTCINNGEKNKIKHTLAHHAKTQQVIQIDNFDVINDRFQESFGEDECLIVPNNSPR